MWRVPANVIKGGNVMVSGIIEIDSTFAALAAGAAYTSINFAIRFSPIFDLSAFADQVLTIQAQTRFATAAPGVTWRNTDNPFLTVANQVFRLTAYRVPNVFCRWVITNNSGVNATVTEVVLINRSL